MNWVVSKAGRLRFLDFLSGALAHGGLQGMMIHLFTNNVTPTVDSVLGDFTEPVDPSLAAQAAVTWASATLAPGDFGNTTATDLTWVNGSASTVPIYGFFVTDPTDGAYQMSARLDSAPINLVPGQGMVLTPQFQDTTIFTA